MDATVFAAWIAAGVSAVTCAGTLAMQNRGYRAASRDADKALKEQREHLDLTLGEQREQIDKTLKAQSDQLDRTLSEQRTRTFNERFAAAAAQLGSDKPPEVRLAGVYAMAGLADDWAENRQVCVDVLCAYLRMPYKPEPAPDADEEKRLAFQASREVRHTVIRVITARLKKDKDDPQSWQGLDFDFTGVVFDGGDFSSAKFSGGEVSFVGVRFAVGGVFFTGAEFSGGRVYFTDARFSGAEVSFAGARFSGGRVYFDRTEFSGGQVKFASVRFSGGEADFSKVHDWPCPPAFPWTDMPPAGVNLPSAGGTANPATA